jgi:peptide/nickel transport system substrate-binding protein
MELNITPVGPFLDALKSGNYDMAGESFAAGDPDVLRTLFSRKNWATPEYASSNMAYFADDQVEQWLEDGFKEQDPAKRSEIYKKVQQFIVQNAATIPIYEFPYSLASSKKVTGIAFDYPGYPVFYDAWIQK